MIPYIFISGLKVAVCIMISLVFMSAFLPTLVNFLRSLLFLVNKWEHAVHHSFQLFFIFAALTSSDFILISLCSISGASILNFGVRKKRRHFP